jgi:hypothetical protein
LEFSCPRYCLDAAGGAKFAKDVIEVLFDRAYGDDQRPPNLLI